MDKKKLYATVFIISNVSTSSDIMAGYLLVNNG